MQSNGYQLPTLTINFTPTISTDALPPRSLYEGFLRLQFRNLRHWTTDPDSSKLDPHCVARISISFSHLLQLNLVLHHYNHHHHFHYDHHSYCSSSCLNVLNSISLTTNLTIPILHASLFYLVSHFISHPLHSLFSHLSHYPTFLSHHHLRHTRSCLANHPPVSSIIQPLPHYRPSCLAIHPPASPPASISTLRPHELPLFLSWSNITTCLTIHQPLTHTCLALHPQASLTVSPPPSCLIKMPQFRRAEVISAMNCNTITTTK